MKKLRNKKVIEMESLFRYLIIASISITLLFLVYQFFLKKENNFKFARAFLISGLFFSLLLPFNSYHIELPFGTSQQNTTEFIEEAPSNNLVVDAQQTHLKLTNKD
jgi:hypothetical protein